MKHFTPAPHFLACALFAAACTAERGAQATGSDPGSVENIEWKLVALDGAPVTGASRGAPTITLSSKDQRVTGFAGCNQLTGGYELKREQLHFTAIATTRMFCPDPNPETALLRALDATSRWKVEDRTLDLLDASDNSVARWTVTVIESGGVGLEPRLRLMVSPHSKPPEASPHPRARARS